MHIEIVPVFKRKSLGGNNHLLVKNEKWEPRGYWRGGCPLFSFIQKALHWGTYWRGNLNCQLPTSYPFCKPSSVHVDFQYERKQVTELNRVESFNYATLSKPKNLRKKRTITKQFPIIEFASNVLFLLLFQTEGDWFSMFM